MGLMDAVPQEMRGEKCRVVILGQTDMLVEMHRGLVFYETDSICFRVKGGYLTVQGRDMVISAFGSMDARVQGMINGVQWQGEKP